MSIENLVSDKLYQKLNEAKATLHSAESCLADKDYEQAAVRLQMLGQSFTSFEMDIISEVMP